jgi:hypothetical protein
MSSWNGDGESLWNRQPAVPQPDFHTYSRQSGLGSEQGACLHAGWNLNPGECKGCGREVDVRDEFVAHRTRWEEFRPFTLFVAAAESLGGFRYTGLCSGTRQSFGSSLCEMSTKGLPDREYTSVESTPMPIIASNSSILVPFGKITMDFLLDLT